MYFSSSFRVVSLYLKWRSLVRSLGRFWNVSWHRCLIHRCQGVSDYFTRAFRLRESIVNPPHILEIRAVSQFQTPLWRLTCFRALKAHILSSRGRTRHLFSRNSVPSGYAASINYSHATFLVAHGDVVGACPDPFAAAWRNSENAFFPIFWRVGFENHPPCCLKPRKSANR